MGREAPWPISKPLTNTVRSIVFAIGVMEKDAAATEPRRCVL